MISFINLEVILTLNMPLTLPIPCGNRLFYFLICRLVNAVQAFYDDRTNVQYIKMFRRFHLSLKQIYCALFTIIYGPTSSHKVQPKSCH